MKYTAARQGALGVLTALFSILIVIGSLALSLTEDGMSMALLRTTPGTLTPTSAFPQPSETYSIVAATSMVTPVISPTPMPTPSFTPIPPSPTPPPSCLPPDGWLPITVQLGDTLQSLARTYNVTEAVLAQANCLVTNSLIAGMILYVPGFSTPVPIVVCGPPSGWVYYIVQPSDTLYKLSLIYKVSVAQLQLANCLGTSTYIRVGQRLFVPFYLPPTPTFTLTPTVTRTPTPTLTPSNTATLPVGFTPAPTNTFTPSPTSTATSTSTSTPTSTSTFTPTPTATSTATLTFTPTPGGEESP